MRVRLVLAWLLALVVCGPTSGSQATGLQCCGGGGGVSSFEDLQSGVNDSATMTCDTGCILNSTGSTLHFLEPSGSGTNYTAFQAQAQAGNVTYTLPAADATVSGYQLSSNGSGTLSWTAAGSSTVIQADSGGTTSGATVTLTGGAAGIDTTRSGDTVTVSTDSSEAGFLASTAGPLTCSSETGKIEVDTTNGALSWCNASTLKQAAFGNDSGQAHALDQVNCNTGVATDSSGVVSCLASASSTPNYIGAWYTVEAGQAAFAIGTAVKLSTTLGQIKIATVNDIDIVGCAQQAAPVGAGDLVFVGTAGEMYCIVDSGSNTGELMADTGTAGHLDALLYARFKRYGRILDASTSPMKVWLYPGGGYYMPTTYLLSTYVTSTLTTTEQYYPISGKTTTPVGVAAITEVEMPTGAGWIGTVVCQASIDPANTITMNINKNGSVAKTSSITNTTATNLGDALDFTVVANDKLTLSAVYSSGTYTGVITCRVPLTFVS